MGKRTYIAVLSVCIAVYTVCVGVVSQYRLDTDGWRIYSINDAYENECRLCTYTTSTWTQSLTRTATRLQGTTSSGTSCRSMSASWLRTRSARVTGRTSLRTGDMTAEERIILLSRARSLLEGRGSVRLSEVSDLVVRVLDSMVEESYSSIAR